MMLAGVILSEAKDLAFGIKIMWLPKDQRILLSYYCSQGRADYICQRDPNALIAELRKRKRRIEPDETYVMSALRALQKHALVQNVRKVPDTGQIEVKPTQHAIDLGRKYSSTIGTLGVWFTEYLWLLVVLSIVISAIGILTTIIAIIKD